MPPQTNHNQHHPKADLGVGYLVLTSRQTLSNILQKLGMGRLVGQNLGELLYKIKHITSFKPHPITCDYYFMLLSDV